MTGETTAYQSALLPGHASLTVGIRVGESLYRPSLTAKEAVQVRTDLVGTTGFSGVALSTTSLQPELA